MTEYIRQITENGLKNLGYTMNKIAYLKTNEPETQRALALIALEIERILTNEIVSLERD